GDEPKGGVTIVGNTLFGTTSLGGGTVGLGAGTLYAMALDGSGFRVVHAFSSGLPNDGDGPKGRLALVGTTLYGTTSLGGADGNGIVFAVSIPEPSSVVLASLG